MVASLRCEIGEDFAVAQSAARWLSAFYPDVALILDRDGAQLASDRRSESELALIWKTTLANEKLLARGAARRAAVIEALVQ